MPYCFFSTPPFTFTSMKFRILLLSLSFCFQLGAASFNNPGFESGSDGWRFWAREQLSGRFEIVNDAAGQTGQHAARVEHSGEKDWSLEPLERVPVKPGEFYELSMRVRAEGEGSVTLCFSIWDAQGQATDWSYGERAASLGAGWQLLRSRVIIPEGIVQAQPRLIGYGKTVVFADDFELRKVDLPGLRQRAELPATLTIASDILTVSLRASDATLSVRDQRTGRTWNQWAKTKDTVLQDAKATSESIELKLFHVPSGLDLTAVIRLVPAKPEFTFEIQGEGPLPSPVRFPQPFETAPGDWLVIPMNEGISYPVEDQAVPLHRLIAYGGHGICMGFWGVTDGAAGHMAIIETPDDAAIQMSRHDARLLISPEWDPQTKAFGYTRKLRYVFFDRGGHVAMAKRYRAYAQEKGLLKTLAEKRRFNPDVDLLIGAVNVWCWDRDAVSIVKEMQAAGIDRILWSNRQSPESLRTLNELGVLTSRYDIYQDVMNPAEFPRLRSVHPDWTSDAWPHDIILGANGKWIKGWGVEAKDGSMISCGVICDKQALPYAQKRVPLELAKSPYKCRFIDTTTAAPWNECYHTNHPMTRTESRRFKMELLRYFSEDLKLVTGCETGHDASVPFLHYFEGMLSLGPYRVPDAGRRMQTIWTNVPEPVAKFQLGHNYRLPLWELVYHDCVVAQWYWGDYNNKLPALWNKRDLFNLLYGTPPMFMFDRKLWAQDKDRFVQSYKNICPHIRKIGYSEMTDHQFLTSDRTVQQTTFASGHKITVNFGASAFTLPGGAQLQPSGFLIEP